MTSVVLRLRRSIANPVPPSVWPEGIKLVAFEPREHARAVHNLLAEAYAQGGGSVEAFERWWPALRDDAEYEPRLCFAAAQDHGQIVGIAQCWTSAFIKDLAVHRAFRRRGLGSALLFEVFRVFRERGAPFVDLKVEADNPSGAVRLYRALGMQTVEEA